MHSNTIPIAMMMRIIQYKPVHSVNRFDSASEPTTPHSSSSSTAPEPHYSPAHAEGLHSNLHRAIAIAQCFARRTEAPPHNAAATTVVEGCRVRVQVTCPFCCHYLREILRLEAVVAVPAAAAAAAVVVDDVAVVAAAAAVNVDVSFITLIVQSIISRRDFNGCFGRVSGAFNSESGRWPVRVFLKEGSRLHLHVPSIQTDVSVAG
jgi:hypothetical protein